MSYKVVVNFKPIGFFPDKKLAFKAFLLAMVEGVNNKTISTWQQIETMCWIEENEKYLCSFYEARDEAIDLGWFDKGQWIAD